ncbi:MAG: PhnD/SsuA/transferrin family substrate-binding protein, partial [Methyloprofundus sp.]|nr:PhnD/SsuA/transferrin family substrate-binding protein [Methyloprofundus sp.]
MLSSAMLQAAQPLNLGVFAYRPKPVMLARYQPLVDYLNQQLACCEVKLHILTLAEMEVAVAANQLDLIFTNPRHYILLRHQNKLTGAIATLVKHGASNIGTQY